MKIIRSNSHPDMIACIRAQAHLDTRAKRGDGPQRPGRPCRIHAADGRECGCRDMSRAAITALIGDQALNRRCWRSLAVAQLARRLKHDGWRLRHIATNEAEPGIFGLNAKRFAAAERRNGPVAVFSSKNGKLAWHVFFDDQAPEHLRRGARRIAREDRNQFHAVAVLVFPTRRALDPWRDVRRAKDWPRGLMLAFDEVADAANPDDALPVSCPALIPSPAPDKNTRAIAETSATIRENIQVGGATSPYFKMNIDAPALTDIAPGQFIMLDPESRRRTLRSPATTWPAFKAAFPRMPATYLKRPFGIHRAFYPGFDPNVYLRRLALPPSLAPHMHTVRPHAFDIFYKTPPRGKGTRTLCRLKAGQTVQLLGPLGSPFNLEAMLARGVDEVHAIGGGVGMAPLVFLIQALRFRGIAVKAFIGIDSLANLRYPSARQRKQAQTGQDMDFTAGRNDALVYIDDLLETGLAPEDIYLSSDLPGDVPPTIPASHYRVGLIGDLYATVLRRQPKAKRVEALTCGPEPMMKAIHTLTRPHDIRLHVLMEKRMACGIGVCLSCVCKTNQGYARVCREGPVFEAKDILWT